MSAASNSGVRDRYPPTAQSLQHIGARIVHCASYRLVQLDGDPLVRDAHWIPIQVTRSWSGNIGPIAAIASPETWFEPFIPFRPPGDEAALWMRVPPVKRHEFVIHPHEHDRILRTIAALRHVVSDRCKRADIVPDGRLTY